MLSAKRHDITMVSPFEFRFGSDHDTAPKGRLGFDDLEIVKDDERRSER